MRKDLKQRRCPCNLLPILKVASIKVKQNSCRLGHGLGVELIPKPWTGLKSDLLRWMNIRSKLNGLRKQKKLNLTHPSCL